jgi:hypothetical protein
LITSLARWTAIDFIFCGRWRTGELAEIGFPTPALRAVILEFAIVALDFPIGKFKSTPEPVRQGC